MKKACEKNKKCHGFSKRNGKFWCMKYKSSKGHKEKDHYFYSKRAAKPCKAKKPVAPKSTFADESFLGSEAMFKEADAARKAFEAEHMKLVKARFATAHKYFSAKDKEASAKIVRARWNKAWNASIKVHEKAIAHHDMTVKELEAAVARKLKAIAHHKITVARLHTANVHRSAALHAWNKSKDALKEAHSSYDAAEADLKDATTAEAAMHKMFDEKHATR